MAIGRWQSIAATERSSNWYSSFAEGSDHKCKKMKKHDPEEISTILLRYEDLTSRGQSQKAVCNELGISVMTLHRWRKLARSEDFVEPPKPPRRSIDNGVDHEDDTSQIDQLKIENGRLRRIVSDLLLEKMKIQEALDKAKDG
jgi:putative transposase